jgi:hypothetical protein
MNDAPELVAPRLPEAGVMPADGNPVTTSKDVRAINRALTKRRERYGGLRPRFASFRCPWPCTKGQYEQVRKEAVDKWIADEAKRGWDLKGKVYVSDHHRQAYGYSGDWLSDELPGYVEISVGAWFVQPKMKRQRMEVRVSAP